MNGSTETVNIDALVAVHNEIAGCRRCVAAGYLPEATPVFRGHAGQRVMIVGQAPGAHAYERGVPWSGPSGRLLRSWLARAGFPEDDFLDTWYLTSLTKCFPGKAAGSKGDRAPSGAELRLCRDYLDREIALVQPEIVVTLGRMAAGALMPEVRRLPLAELIGTAREADLGYGPVPIVSLPHPSGVSRWLNDPANRVLVDQGLALLAAERERRRL